MELSKETFDQIRDEAEDMYQGGNYPVGGLNNQYKREGYIAGATAWAVWKQKAAAERDMLVLDKEGLVKALERIANPIIAMQEECKKEGTILDGKMAIQLADDPYYLRSIATKTLEQFK